MFSNKSKKVFIAMSGGVDSSVAAALLKDAGYDVVGVTRCVSISYPDRKRPSCCDAESIRDARRAARLLNIPHCVLDFKKDLRHFVIQDFMDEYVNGRTPNPCVRCNQYLKFGTLFKKTKALGADFLATGHYARIVLNKTLKEFEIRKAKDRVKDQSYFLYGIKKKMLSKILFPIGNFTKLEVRGLAKKYLLNTAEKRASQDICFVSGGGYKQFMEKRFDGALSRSGPFIDCHGKVVGMHKGIFNYTIGQRDKLGIALGYPAYVYKIDRKTNTIYVGPEKFLYAKGLWAGRLKVLSRDLEKQGNQIEVALRIRYNASEVKGILRRVSRFRIRIDFLKPQKAVTPGQSVVLYKNDRLLGGAVIDNIIL